MKVSEAIDELVVATRAAGHSEQTAVFYQRKLKSLVEHLEDMPVEQVTISDLRRFVTHLRSRETRWDAHPNKRQRAFHNKLCSIESSSFVLNKSSNR